MERRQGRWQGWIVFFRTLLALIVDLQTAISDFERFNSATNALDRGMARIREGDDRWIAYLDQRHPGWDRDSTTVHVWDLICSFVSKNPGQSADFIFAELRD